MQKRPSFKESFSEETRKRQSGEIIQNYEDTIPIIVEKSRSSTMKEFDRKRYLVPKEIKVYNLICLVRKRMKMNRLYALTLFVNGNEMLKSDSKIAEVYEKYKDRDGFLYLEYKEHLAFG